jgi:hypothetical protein
MTSFTHAACEEDALCVVCQCDTEPGDECYAGRCAHRLHRACAAAYVREWRLNHEASDAPACPLCKAVDGFCNDAIFPRDAGGAHDEERERRAAQHKAEQERDDALTAQALLFEEFFGSEVTVLGRVVLRRRDADVLARLTRAMQDRASGRVE